MMYRNSQKFHLNVTDRRATQRVLAILCTVLFVTTIVFGAIALRNGTYRSRANEQFPLQMLNAVSHAIEEVDRMAGMVTSNTSARLAKVRQYVYYMEQLNELSINLAGGESGRLAPDSAFTALYADLDQFDAITQQATTSTLDARTALGNHLMLLREILSAE